MALNLDAIGKKIGPFTKKYTSKDVILYALGIGADFNSLDYCYEKNLKTLPTFSIAAIHDTFLNQVAMDSNVNLAGILHGEQELIFHNEIPIEGTLTTEGAITNYYDKGKKGALVVAKSETTHLNGKKLFTNIITIYSRFDGGFEGENSPKKEFNFPDRKPDYIIKQQPSADQPLIYRLSGDTFALHVDPDFAQNAGFKKPIMHGLCTYGFACRALIDTFTPGKPENVRRFCCRFSKPLYPGTKIKTLIWKIDEKTAYFQTIDDENNHIVIDNGIFEFGEKTKKTIKFDNKVAIVTGAGAGLGKTYAVELASRGAKVIVNDFGGDKNGTGNSSQSPADIVVSEIKSLGGEAVANYDNVATFDGGQNIVKTALNAYGTIDILINNAGILRDKTLIKMEPMHWKSIIDVHLNGAFNVTRPAFSVMKEKGYGRIIFTTSAAGLYGNFGQTNYSAAKAALIGFMNTLKIEGLKYNIKINTVAPIAISRLTEGILPEDLIDMAKPEFVSPLVLYLASDICSNTGNIYNAGLGVLNRAAIVTGSPIKYGEKDQIPTAEDIFKTLDSVSELKEPKEFKNLHEFLNDVVTSC